MTTGQLLLYSGIGLLIMTVVLAIVFVVRKPKYVPESAVSYDGQTAPLRSGYPTDPVTIRREISAASLPQQTEMIAAPVRVPDGTVPLSQNTELLVEEQGTVPLDQATIPLSAAETEVLPESSEILQGTVPLNERE